MLKLLLYAPIRPLPPSPSPRFSGIGASVVVGFSFYIISFRLISIFRQISHTHTRTQAKFVRKVFKHLHIARKKKQTKNRIKC